MKIVRVRMKDKDPLIGDWKIDYADPAYADGAAGPDAKVTYPQQPENKKTEIKKEKMSKIFSFTKAFGAVCGVAAVFLLGMLFGKQRSS